MLHAAANLVYRSAPMAAQEGPAALRAGRVPHTAASQSKANASPPTKKATKIFTCPWVALPSALAISTALEILGRGVYLGTQIVLLHSMFEDLGAGFTLKLISCLRQPGWLHLVSCGSVSDLPSTSVILVKAGMSSQSFIATGVTSSCCCCRWEDSCRPCAGKTVEDACEQKIKECTVCSTGCVKQYKVQSGDNCWGIAQVNGISLSRLQEMNPGLKCMPLEVGVEMCVAQGNTSCRRVCEGKYV